MRRRWLWIVGAAALASALRFLAGFPWRETWDVLMAADWTLLAAAGGLNLLSLAAKAWAWQLVLQPIAPARWRTTQAAVFAGAAVGSIAIGVSGEAARLGLLGRRDGVAPAVGLRSIVISRVVEAAALGVFLVGAVLGSAPATPWRLAGLALAVLAGALALLRWMPWLRTSMRLGAPLAIGVAGWTLQWGAYHWAIAAAGISVTPGQSVLALLLANLGGILRLTPGNLGIVPGAVVLAVRPAHVPLARAVAAGLALQSVQVLPVLVIGLALLGRLRIRSPAIAP